MTRLFARYNRRSGSKKIFVFFFILLALVQISGCGGSGSNNNSKSLISITVTAAAPSVLVGSTDQFKATGTYSDKSTADLTRTAAWNSSVAADATITSSGLATGVAAGTTNITVTVGSVTSSQFSLTVIGYTETALYTFTGGKDGNYPNGGLISDAKGNLYGTTDLGGDGFGGSAGAYGCGVVFELSPPANGTGSWTETVLYNFAGGDGCNPNGGMIFDAKGNLYGTASGGSAGGGVVFELSPPANGTGSWTETVLYTFNPISGASDPDGGLIFDSEGNLYGTTNGVGPSCTVPLPCGLVFKLSPPASGTGWTQTVLFTLGAETNGLIFDAKGNLYGTTGSGGTGSCSVIVEFPIALGGCGVVFTLSSLTNSTDSWTETVLYNFTGAKDGGVPNQGLIFDSDGNLYGTTEFGGMTQSCAGETLVSGYPPPPGCGVVFKLSSPTNGTGSWTETVLHSFTGGKDGDAPTGLIFDPKGNLYGTTGLGGDTSGPCSSISYQGLGFNGCGIVFELSPPASGSGSWTETALYSFTGGKDGSSLNAGLIVDATGNLYGTTEYGGDSPGGTGNGVVFELSPSSGTTATSMNLR
jgi:hypothetical protein